MVAFVTVPTLLKFSAKLKTRAGVILKLAGLTQRLFHRHGGSVPPMGVDGASCNDPRQQKHGRRTSVHDLRARENLRADIENRFAELLNQDYPSFLRCRVRAAKKVRSQALRT